MAVSLTALTGSWGAPVAVGPGALVRVPRAARGLPVCGPLAPARCRCREDHQRGERRPAAANPSFEANRWVADCLQLERVAGWRAACCEHDQPRELSAGRVAVGR